MIDGASPRGTHAPAAASVRSRLSYGINEAGGWRHFAFGPHRTEITECLRTIGTRIVRIYAFDRYSPDPIRDWPGFAAYVQRVLDAGAVPMITLTRFRPPFEDTSVLRWFVHRCGELVWNCREEWGGETIRHWY